MLCQSVSRLCRWALLRHRHSPPVARVSARNDRSFNSWPVARAPGIWKIARSSKELAGSHVHRVRFYSQVESEGQKAAGAACSENVGEQEAIVGIDAEDEPRTATFTGEVEQRSLFYDQLRACPAPVDVLELSAQYILTLNRTSITLGRVWETLKAIPEEQKSYHLELVYEHPAFKELCALLVRNAPKMKCSDVVYCLLAVVRLGVSQRSRLVQTLLRVTQENLNDLDEKSLSILASCLGNMESCKNVSALKKGLGLVVWGQVPAIQNVVALQSMMRCLGTEASVSMKKRLEEKALSMANQFTLPNAQYMFITLASMNFFSKPLLDICRDKLLENIQAIPFNRLLYVLKACESLKYRDYVMLSAISEYLETTFEVWNQKQLFLYLLAFERLGFRAAALIDRIADSLLQNPASFTKRDIISMLRMCSSLNHDLEHRRTEFLASVTGVLEHYLPRMSPSELLHTVFFLCVLGHFPSALVEKLLQEDTLRELLSQDGDNLGTAQHRLQSIDRCLRLDWPSAPFMVPPDCLPPRLSHSSPPVRSDLMKMLQGIVGDDTVQEAVILDSGYFIDYLITLSRSGGESESVAPGSFLRLAVLKAYTASFCTGTRHPRGQLALRLRHLQALGYTPVLVHDGELESLCQNEKEAVLRNLVLGVTKDTLTGTS